MLIDRKIKATAIAILLSIPLCLVINITLSKMILEPIIDIWDIVSISILFLLSILLFVFDYIRRIKNTNIK